MSICVTAARATETDPVEDWSDAMKGVLRGFI
jgi:hypothetical protein